MRFRARRGGRVVVTADEVEAHVLRQAAVDLLDLLGEGEEPEADPLARLVGLSSGPVAEPEDPALQRLLPNAYPDDLPGASAEFRRYTESDLRAGKRHAAGVVLATLPEGGGSVELDRDQADAWVGCLNDLRLVLGTRLEVTEDDELDPEDDGPRGQALHLYGWLGWQQESLLACLSPRRG